VADRLYRSPDDRMLAGVAGGVAEMFDIDPSIIRIVWAVLIVVTGGLALLVYIVMAIVVPVRPLGVEPRQASGSGAASAAAAGWTAAPSAADPARSAPRSDRSDGARGALVGGLILIVIGGFFLVRELIPSVDFGFWWPTVAIGLGIVLVVLALMPSRRSD
jgi:phage shock protein C